MSVNARSNSEGSRPEPASGGRHPRLRPRRSRPQPDFAARRRWRRKPGRSACRGRFRGVLRDGACRDLGRGWAALRTCWIVRP